jgi:uncharacterized membrane protein YfcA
LTVATLLGDFGWPTWMALVLVVMAGTILQIGAGVGFGSVAGPGGMLLAPPLVPGTMLCLSMLASLLGAGRIEGRIAVGEVAVAMLGRTVGAGLAAWLFAAYGGSDAFALLFAGLTLLGVALSLSGLRLPPSPPALIGAGFLSGLMATVTTMGGPPMALIYQHRPPEMARATLNAFFGFGIVPPLVALWLAGALDGVALARAALLLPAVAVGVLASRLVIAHIDRRYRTVLLVFCVAAAAIIAGRALIRMLA